MPVRIRRFLCRVFALVMLIGLVSPEIFVSYEAEAADNIAPNPIFVKNYGLGLANEEAYDVVANPIGGYAFAGMVYEDIRYEALIL